MHCAVCEADHPPKLLRDYAPYPESPQIVVQVCVAMRLCIIRYIMNASHKEVKEHYNEYFLKTVTLHLGPTWTDSDDSS